MDTRASPFTNSLGIISNSIYSEYSKLNEDIQTKIDYYNEKENYSDDDIIKLESFTKTEWKKALNLLINLFLNEIKKKKFSKDKFKSELKTFNDLKHEIEEIHNFEDLIDYENFNKKLKYEINKLIGKLYSEKIEWGRFWIGIFLGTILGIISTFIFNLFFK
jgi:hypothetical protein